MPHPDIDNDTPLVLEPLFMLDEDGRPALTIVVKASFALEPQGLALLEDQPTLEYGGSMWFPQAERSSYRKEPEVTPYKLATDVAVIAHAWAPRVDTRVLEVGVRVGPLTRNAWVYGDRIWSRAANGQVVLSQPNTFEHIPLCYERAFGGQDPCAPQDFDLRNPVGRGYRQPGRVPLDGQLAPNIEDPSAPIRNYEDRPAPVGFGFVSPEWWPRVGLAGTYDQHWTQHRRPLLPRDFNARFYNAGSAGLVAPGYLRGDESVELLHLGPRPRVGFALPGLPPPAVQISRVGHADLCPPLQLDTVILDLDSAVISLLWRARVPLERGPHDVQALELRSPAALAFPRSSVDVSAPAAANTRPGAISPWA